MLKRIFLVLLVSCLGTSVSFAAAADDAFTGEWKLNPAKSKLVDQMKVESLGGNKYAFDFGGGPETIAVDGTDQAASGGTTLAVSVEGPDWKVVRKKDGRMLLTAIWKLSPGGKTLTDDFTFFSPEGTPSKTLTLYKRRAGGSGFVATWVSTSETVNSELLLRIQPWEGDGLSFISPSEGSTQNLKFEDKDHPQEGYEPKARKTSMRRVDDHTLEITDMKDGKIFLTRQFSLSSHNKILTMKMQPAGWDEASVLVFERQ